MSVLDAPLQLITGKGGVGRTTLTIALGHAYAMRGERTLILEVRDAESELGNAESIAARTDSMLGRALYESFKDESHREIALGPEPLQVTDHLWAAQLVATQGHEEFLTTLIPSGRLVRAALSSQALSRFLRSAPSMHELGLYYHLSHFLDDSRFERIVVDLPASGHTLALTELPERMARLLRRGKIVNGLREGVAALSDPQRCALWVVTLNEELPITESLELAQSLRRDGVAPRGVIFNRVLSRPLEGDEQHVLSEIQSQSLNQSLNQSAEQEHQTRALDLELHTILQRALQDAQGVALLSSFPYLLRLPERADSHARADYISTHWLKPSSPP